MSATNRGAVREHMDYYCTPNYTSRAFFENYDIRRFKNILEPASGDNALVVVMEQYKHRDAIITTNDLRADTPSQYHIDYVHHLQELEDHLHEPPDLIITNPPFRYTKEFILNSLSLVADNGRVVMLQRVNFLGAKCRHMFWQRGFLDEVLVLSTRPKFVRGKTDATEYGWYVFANDDEVRNRGHAKLRVVDDPGLIVQYPHKYT